MSLFHLEDTLIELNKKTNDSADEKVVAEYLSDVLVDCPQKERHELAEAMLASLAEVVQFLQHKLSMPELQ